MDMAVITLAGLLTIAAVLRAMAIAKCADEDAERHWRELGELHSQSGIAFFPTAYAQVELEMAIKELLELEPRVPPPRRTGARRRLVRA